MNINKLEVGQTIKNYSELCIVLGIEYKKGNSKNAQFKELERAIRYRKEGHKFIVEEIFDTMKEKDDNRTLGGNTSSYSRDAELLLIDLLLCGNGELMLPNTSLMKALQFVNHNYSLYYGDNRPLLADGLNVDLELVNDYYKHVNSSLVGNLKTILDRLERKKLLYHQEVTMVKVVEQISINHNEDGLVKLDITSDMNSNGLEKIKYKVAPIKTREVYRKATTNEIRKILRIQREVMIQLGFNKDDKYNALYKNGLTFKFNNIVNKRLLKELNILRSYKSHHLIFNNDQLEDERVYLLDELEKELIKNNVNEEVRKRIIKNAENRSKNSSVSLLNKIYKDNEDVQANPFSEVKSDIYISQYELLNEFLIDNNISPEKEYVMTYNKQPYENHTVDIELPELM